MLTRLSAVLFVAACLFLSSAPGAPAAERTALVFGNSAYRNLAKLPNPRNDAGDIAKLLRSLGFDVIEGLDLDRNAMEDALTQFRQKLDHAKLAVFFYAGHGLQVDGKNYLIPIDAKIEKQADLNFQAVNLDYVLKQMDVQRRINLIFLDACRDNPLPPNLARAVAGNDAAGLAPIKGAVDTMIAYSTEPDNTALDGDGRNSPYTTALLKLLPTAGQDITRIMRQVRRDVLDATDRKQVPWEHISLVDDVILKPGNAEARPIGSGPAAPPPEQKPVTSNRAVLAAECDRLAADPFSPSKPANVRGVGRYVVSRDAISICGQAWEANPDIPRLLHELGRAYYADEDFANARKAFEQAEKLGVVESTTELCRMHFFGHSYPKNLVKARQLCESAAERGDPSAIKNIGFFYHKGHGVKQSYAKALEWYMRAPNHPTVMNNLAVLYYEGAGVPRNPRKAVALWEKAVLGLDDTAHSNLGELYENGHGVVPRDMNKAVLLYRMGAALGDKESIRSLARLGVR
jgi:tetratricopeptide (TPR) repeat protein